MADWNSADPTQAMDAAFAMFENESRKLAELGKHWEEASTTVRAKDHSLEMTLDGRGELVELVFNASKYRAMPPAQLAQVIVETLRQGRVQAQQKMNDLMGIPEIPGMDLAGLANGQVRPDEMISQLIGPMFDTLNEFGVEAERPGLGGGNSSGSASAKQEER
ncbi:YbaB/EbfC family nucleoid-associated protein [Actinophytocola oryzae]|uniref:YbaB/EbfC DNA-binding family protein n=1 Tax=Actinophytocola oryzae TaxID=502181 RepID=A0A4V3FR48_9PSEU|nr:YbaB/EbfC family nucleoid-associated protein [Actinophytocola oryzae]TDV42171.1 YbaB/EbfC DNA-binding family protein [Actinophytocola oryzae]